MASKKPTDTVVHDKLYLSGPDGRLAHVRRGTALSLSADVSKRLQAKGRTVPHGQEVVEVTDRRDEAEAADAEAATSPPPPPAGK